MSFSDLPLELIYQIAEHLEFEKDVNALIRVNKCFYRALNSYLYRRDIKEWEQTGFEDACIYGRHNSMRIFLKEGMPLDGSDDYLSPLFLTAAFGYEDIVKYLLERDADPNVRNDSRGPFDFAVRNGHEGTVRLLIPHMKSVDYFVEGESAYMTPLTLAAMYGHLNLVKMLVEELKCSVDPTPDQEDGRESWKDLTPLACAACEGHTDIVRYLLNVGRDLDVNVGEAALEAAVIGNHFETAKTLIDYGANPDPSERIRRARTSHRDGRNGYTYVDAYARTMQPLGLAMFYGNQETLRLMLQHIDWERTLESDVEDISFLVPLAAACGLDGIVQRLLENGCDANTGFLIRRPSMHADASNALSLACRFGHIGVARILLGHGADPNEPEVPGHIKPLVAAVSAGHEQVVELLLDAGANPNTMDRTGDPIIMLAVHSESIFKMLLSRGVDSSSLGPSMRSYLFEEVLESENVPVLSTLLDTKLGLSITEEPGGLSYIMKQAATTGTAMFEYTMQYLWHQFGVKPSPQNEDSQHALEYAIEVQNAEVVEILLLRYGLEFKSQDVADYLMRAASTYEDGDTTKAEIMLEVLLRHGADINARRSDGHTCLSLLVTREDAQGAELVIRHGAKYPMTCVVSGKCLLAYAASVLNDYLLKPLLRLIEVQGIPLEDIEPQLQEVEANTPTNTDDMSRLGAERLIQHFRCRRKYPVPQ